MKRVLVVAPHTDDAELGCGGTMARLVEEGVDVWCVALSICEESVPFGLPSDILEVELRRSTEILGLKPDRVIALRYSVRKLNYVRQEILDSLIHLRQEIRPDTVFIPSSSDVHQDHQVAYAEGLRAFKQSTVLGYELPWNHITFPAEFFVKLNPVHIERKWKALQEYRSQEHRPYMTADAIAAVAKVRGLQVGSPYAEAFQALRVII